MKSSPTRSDFPPHLLATIRSPNLRPRAAVNYATRPLPAACSSSSVAGSASVPSSPATRKSSSSAFGRSKAKVRHIDRPDVLVIGTLQTPDPYSAYTQLLPVCANSVPNSPGSSKRQTQTDASSVGVRPHCALPRTTASTKTQTGSSLTRAADVASGNSTSGGVVSRLARPTTLTPVAASVQRRRLPSPPSPPDRDVGDDIDCQRGSCSVGTATSPHSVNTTSAHVTSGRRQGSCRPEVIEISGGTGGPEQWGGQAST